MQDVFRTTAIKALSERLTQNIAGANEQAARDTDQLFEEQAELGRRKQELDRGLQEAQVRIQPNLLQALDNTSGSLLLLQSVVTLRQCCNTSTNGRLSSR